MEAGVTKHAHCFLALCLCLLWSVRSAGQQSLDVLEIPSQFKLDFEAAARLRPQLMAQSHPASEHYSTGNLVLNRLVEQVPAPSGSGFQWNLRIVDDDDSTRMRLLMELPMWTGGWHDLPVRAQGCGPQSCRTRWRTSCAVTGPDATYTRKLSRIAAEASSP